MKVRLFLWVGDKKLPERCQKIMEPPKVKPIPTKQIKNLKGEENGKTNKN